MESDESRTVRLMIGRSASVRTWRWRNLVWRNIETISHRAGPQALMELMHDAKTAKMLPLTLETVMVLEGINQSGQFLLARAGRDPGRSKKLYHHSEIISHYQNETQYLFHYSFHRNIYDDWDTRNGSFPHLQDGAYTISWRHKAWIDKLIFWTKMSEELNLEIWTQQIYSMERLVVFDFEDHKMTW